MYGILLNGKFMEGDVHVSLVPVAKDNGGQYAMLLTRLC